MGKRAMAFTWIFWGIILMGTPVFAWTVPDTGQTTCYDDDGNVISCPSPGERFYGQDANYTINPPSYTKLDATGNDLPDSATSWVMVRDNVTGLIWEVKTDDGSIHDKDQIYNWYDAQNVFIASLKTEHFGGFADWRLPGREEMRSICDYAVDNPSIKTHYFPNTVSSEYW